MAEHRCDTYQSVSRPNVLAILLKDNDNIAPERVTALNRELSAKGILYAGAASFGPVFRVSTCCTLLVYFTYRVPGDANLLDKQHARLVSVIARIFRRHRAYGWLLGRGYLSQLLRDSQEAQAIVAAARCGDRDLTLPEGEIFVSDLSQNRMRSSVWLVRRGDRLLVRKAYSKGCSQIGNEIAARAILRDARVVEIVEQRDTVLYFPYIDVAKAWKGRLFEFFPLEQAQIIFDFLGDVARAGYSMVDINPSAFLFGQRDNLKVVDFEFFTRTSPAATFAESKDYSGDFDGVLAPAKNGYKRYWRDALGGDLVFVLSASPWCYTLWKMIYLILHRVPKRTFLAMERLTKQAIALVVWLTRSKKDCFRI